MKDILVILTGGTIGSCIKNGSINIDNSSKCMVVEKYKELYEKELKCTKPDHTAQNNDSDTDVTDRFEVRESFFHIKRKLNSFLFKCFINRSC